jgi:hypothetical protein
MNELLRLDYLDAMGITQYVARKPLPGARPSPVIQLAVQSPEQPAPEPQAPEKSGRMTSLIGADLPDKKNSQATSAKPIPATPASITDAAPTSLPDTFHCQIAIWTVGDLLVLADAPRLDNSQLTLLRNILQAIGRTDNLSDVKQFSWPLPQRKDKSLLAAKEHFQGLLDGGLLQTSGLRQILCFGQSVITLLNTGDTDTENMQQYRDWPVITVCALHEMLAQPSRKADTWRTLQVLVRT